MLIFFAAAHRPPTDTGEIVRYPGDKPYVFSTFWEIGARNAKDPMTGMMRLHECGCPLIMMDSGAHSFFSIDPSIRSASAIQADRHVEIPDPEEYFERYINWLSDNRDVPMWDYAFELDLDKIVGYKLVKKWRKRFGDAGLANRIVPVWHTSLDPKEWKNLCAYANDTGVGIVGIEGPAASGGRLDYMPYIKWAYQHGVRVHIFAAVKPYIMQTYPTFSVDSTSWKSAYRFGINFRFNRSTGSMKKGNLTFNVQPKRYRPMKHADIVKLNEETASVVANQNLTASTPGIMQPTIEAFLEMQAYYTELWKSRGIEWEPLPRRRSMTT